MITTYTATPGIDVITSAFPIPGFGLVPINAYVMQGPEPVLVDTGSVIESEEFLAVLRTVIDPADLRWIWLTHSDFDHIGSLQALLAENPRLRVITTFLGVGVMSLASPIPLDRVHLLNPGERFTAGHRSLTALRPPAFDNPVTTGFHDSESGALFSADCFGALLQAVPERATELSDDELRQGQVLWATIDSPWLHKVDPSVLAGELDAIRRLDPTMILSSHLPAAPATMLEQLLDSLRSVPAAMPFVGPDQSALEHLLASMTAGAMS